MLSEGRAASVSIQLSAREGHARAHVYAGLGLMVGCPVGFRLILF